VVNFTKFEILRLSVLELTYDVCHWLRSIDNAFAATAHVPYDLCVGRGKIPHIFQIPVPDFSIHFATFKALQSR